MSSRYENITVYAVDTSGECHRIYDCNYYAGGCEYKDVIAVKNAKYQICWYPLEDKVEETGEKLPSLKPADLQSYFSAEPTKQICQVMKMAMPENKSVVQFNMVICQENTEGCCKEQYIRVTSDGMKYK